MSEAHSAIAAVPARRGLLSRKPAALLELSKARLSLLVVITTAVGFVLASGDELDYPLFIATLTGTLLSAFGANGLNQWIEADRDARMRRTARRPLVTGELTPAEAALFASGCAIVGPLLLLWFVNLATGVLALLTIALYILMYTPLKVRTPLNTLVGAVVGAIPPMMGWTAASGELAAGAWILAGILFVWQIPHFLALAWMYREDYARGGYQMLPSVDPSGRLTAWSATVTAVLLVPTSVGLACIGHCGWTFGVLAILAGGAFVYLALRLALQRSDRAARRLFFGSILYLPLILGVMVADRETPPETKAPARAPHEAILFHMLGR